MEAKENLRWLDVFASKRAIMASLRQPPTIRKEVIPVEVFMSFVVSIAAEIVAYFLCKWLDGDD